MRDEVRQLDMDKRKLVKTGYNRIAAEYLMVRAKDSEDVRLLQLLVEGLPAGARVLDAGCGAGVPVAQFLARFLDVTGVDLSIEQVRLAQSLVPRAHFVCTDMTSLTFRDGSFDAICSYYAIIHVPRSEHHNLLRNFHRILKPGGLALLCVGWGDLPEDLSDYHGVKMYWSHYDRETNMELLKQSGFEILSSKRVEGATDGVHLFVLVRKQHE